MGGATGGGGRGGSGSGGAAGGRGGGGSGGAEGQGLVCGGGRCQVGELCCYDINGNGTCAVPPAVCTGSPLPCNTNQICPEFFYCEITSPGRCLASAVGGVCIQPPTGCTRIYQPVCGCNGQTYGNDCERRAAGIQLDHIGAC